MAADKSHFDDAEGYELFMGRWSRASGSLFLDWLGPPQGGCWLEVGCGSGAFTTLVDERCRPAQMIAVDPAPAQIEYALRLPVAQRAEFRVADAQDLPFSDATFDVVASAFVINFIPDRLQGVREMRRVTRAGGVVAGCVWDFAGDRGPNQPVRNAILEVGGEVRRQAGADETTLVALKSLFEQAGFDKVEAKAMDVSLDFPSAEEYFRAQTPRLHPMTRTIEALPEADRARLLDLVRAQLTAHAGGGVACSARANAIKARVLS